MIDLKTYYNHLLYYSNNKYCKLIIYKNIQFTELDLSKYQHEQLS